MGLTNLNFKKPKVRMQFYQNPRLRDKILTIQSLKIPCDPYKIHTQSSFHTLACLVSLLLLLPLPLLLSFCFSLSTVSLLCQNMRPILVFKAMFVKAMFGLFIKPIFGLAFSNCKKVPPCLTICIPSSQIVFWPIVSSIYDF